MTWDRRGATFALNFLHPGGRVVDERLVDRRPAANHISVRTGCFCKPGAGAAAFALSKEAMMNVELSEDDLRRLPRARRHAHRRRGAGVARARE
jgi:hypothetical protein